MSLSPDTPPETAAPAAHGLQFDKAEAPTRSCSFCSTGLASEYFQVAGADACRDCANQCIEQQRSPSAGAILKAALFGFGAMVACAGAYALFLYVSQGWTIGWVAIFIGMGVGRAIRMGAGGLGGRRCQWMAVVFTYLASTLGYAPSLYNELVAKGREDAAQVQKKAEDELKKAGLPGPVKVEAHVGGPVLAILATVVAPILPILGITEGFSGLITLFIIALGLHQAWKLTARDPREVSGPHGAPPPPLPAS